MNQLEQDSEAEMRLETSNNKEPNGSVTLLIANNLYCWKDEMNQKAYQTFIIESENKRCLFIIG